MIKKYTADELCEQIVDWIEKDIEENDHDLMEWIMDLKEYLKGGPRKPFFPELADQND